MSATAAHAAGRPGRTEPEEALAAFAEVAQKRLGLVIRHWRPEALAARLRAVMEAAGAPGEPAMDFVRRLGRAPEDSAEHEALCDLLPNHETYLFRDVRQLRAALGHALRAAGSQPSPSPLRVLSAGCASGEEAYSIAMLLCDELHRLWGRGAEVWGADVSPASLARARAAAYPAEALRRAGEGPRDWTRRYVRSEEGRVVVRDFVREMCTFARCNLASPGTLWPLGFFDLVVCRNVLIYFDGAALQGAVAAMLQLLRPQGTLLLGASEMGLAPTRGAAVVREGEFSWLVRLPEGPGGAA